MQILQSTFPEIRRIVDPLHQMRTRIDQADRQARPMMRYRQSQPKTGLLHGIVQSIPPDINLTLTRMDFGEDRIVMQGSADNFDSVNRIRDNLEKWKPVRKATISSANVDPGQQRVRFQLTIEIRPDDAATGQSTAGSS
jgi:type II secretory pathway component PulL